MYRCVRFDSGISWSGFIDCGPLCENVDYRSRIRESVARTVSEAIDARIDRVCRTERRDG